MSPDQPEPETVIAARTAMHTEYTRGVYDAYYGPAHLRHAAWLRLLARIEAYCEALAAAAAPVEPEAEQEPETAAETPEETPASLDETPTIEETAPPAPPARAANRNRRRNTK